MSLTLFIKVFGTLGELTLPYILEYLIDEVDPTKSLKVALFWGCLMIALDLITRMLNIAANRRGTALAQKATYEMRRDLFFHSVNLSGNQKEWVGRMNHIRNRATEIVNTDLIYA